MTPASSYIKLPFTSGWGGGGPKRPTFVSNNIQLKCSPHSPSVPPSVSLSLSLPPYPSHGVLPELPGEGWAVGGGISTSPYVAHGDAHGPGWQGSRKEQSISQRGLILSPSAPEPPTVHPGSKMYFFLSAGQMASECSHFTSHSIAITIAFFCCWRAKQITCIYYQFCALPPSPFMFPAYRPPPQRGRCQTLARRRPQSQSVRYPRGTGGQGSLVYRVFHSQSKGTASTQSTCGHPWARCPNPYLLPNDMKTLSEEDEFEW